MPEPRPMPLDRRTARAELLTRAVARRRRSWPRRLAVAMPLAGAVALGSTGALAFFAHDEPAAQRHTIRCYSTSEWNNKGFYSEVAQAGPVGTDAGPVEIGNVLDACATLFRQGFLREGDPRLHSDTDGEPTRPVPRLAACVLPSGQVAVFPSTTCQEQMLPALAG
ncbi:hypothetical protein E1264_32830 [Actinomadura sp. KC216]|uniref:hypothetical protein n=1 Tax=Actinomadura sp. KC216 TaxID=2530370 RepID=UPI001052BE69|nr:hypothetical protein [Actinomadura sp. KC216]TDB81359.1 hypothetical protein E1264_32830 [Actinomadura sp. KC216]